MRVTIRVDAGHLGEVTATEEVPIESADSAQARRHLTHILAVALDKISRAYALDTDWSLH